MAGAMMNTGSESLRFKKDDNILRKIEEICLDIMENISNHKIPQFTFARRGKWNELV